MLPLGMASPGLKECAIGAKMLIRRKTSKVGIDTAGHSGPFVKDGAQNLNTNIVAI